MSDLVLHRPESPSIAEWAVTVEREHQAVAKAFGEALGHALTAGDALLLAQAQMADEDSFERWVEARGLHYRTAQKYMRLATYREQLETLPEFQALSVHRASLYLRGLPKRVAQDEEKEALAEEIGRLHREGVSNKGIGRALGCHPSTVRYHLDPEYRQRKISTRVREQRHVRVTERESETVRRLEIRGGPLQEAHVALAGAEDTLTRAKQEAVDEDERRDIQRAVDSVVEAKHWLARAIRADLDRNRRTKVKHAA